MRISEERLHQLQKVEEMVKYHFKDIGLLNQSLTHTSYAYETEGNGRCQNERMEFLGDVVLNLVISEHLYLKYLDYMEGELAKIRAMVVSRPVLSHLAKEIELGQYLLLGKGEEQSGGRKRSSILANTIEALFGAIYLDGGLEPARKFILNCYGSDISEIINRSLAQDYKTELQEFTQSRFKVLPVYKLVRRKGPDHNQVFEVAVSVKGQVWGEGEGRNKKEAEQKAAYQALKKSKEEVINQ